MRCRKRSARLHRQGSGRAGGLPYDPCRSPGRCHPTLDTRRLRRGRIGTHESVAARGAQAGAQTSGSSSGLRLRRATFPCRSANLGPGPLRAPRRVFVQPPDPSRCWAMLFASTVALAQPHARVNNRCGEGPLAPRLRRPGDGLWLLRLQISFTICNICNSAKGTLSINYSQS